MDLDVKKIIEENLELNKKNNELLLKIYKYQRWSQIARVVYWFIIIGTAFGAFYFLKPLLGNVLNIYTGGNSDTKSLSESKREVSGQNQIEDLLKMLKE
jgi:hypothetical protein